MLDTKTAHLYSGQKSLSILTKNGAIKSRHQDSLEILDKPPLDIYIKAALRFRESVELGIDYLLITTVTYSGVLNTCIIFKAEVYVIIVAVKKI